VSFSNQTKGADSWTWDFGDGATSTARRPSHTYGSPGTYTVTLSAVAVGGATASLSMDVTVSAS
jgi:PKD repeat protein